MSKNINARQLNTYLSKERLGDTDLPGISMPDAGLLQLPERVIQFGTGVLLRGLPDYFIDKANKHGIFNGRIVVVKSTAKGGTDVFKKQDGLYTLCIRGIEEGRPVEETIINTSLSRVLSAGNEWNAVLQCAHNPDIKLVISNTTESGIVLADDDVTGSPPSSFPGKLTAFLYERYRFFKGNEVGGMVIVPTELIPDNGTALKNIVLKLAARNNLETSFIRWLESSNHFCNSLVDCIVPGKLPPADQQALEERLGYADELMITAEPYRLWAIESDAEKVKEVLSFGRCDEGVVITPDIEKFKELKLRLLNGTHSLSCALSVLAGLETVKDAMNDETMFAFVKRLMITEIAPSVDDSVASYKEACAFAAKVLDRFSNPFLQHKWLSISLNYTHKMRLRAIPLLISYFNKTGKTPPCMALAFAAYILFMKCRRESNGACYGEINANKYIIEDASAEYIADLWLTGTTDTVTEALLSNKYLWGYDLSTLDGFLLSVKNNIRLIRQAGIHEAINSCVSLSGIS